MTTKVSVKKHSVRGEKKWVVCYRENGKRKRLFYDTESAAEAEAASVRFGKADAGSQFKSMTPAEKETMVSAWLDAKERGVNPVLALSGAQPVASTNGGPKLVSVIDELIDAKEKSGRSEKYTDQLRIIYNQFQRGRESMAVGKIGLVEIEAFLDSKSLANRSTLRSRLSTLFKFSIRRGYRPDNPCERLESITYHKPTPQVFSPDQFKAATKWLLKSAPHGLSWFALSTVCGLRPEEAEKTEEKRDINFKEGFVKVEAQTTKVRQRRVVYPKPEAMKYLKWAIEQGGRLPLHPESRQRMMQGSEDKPRLREALGFKVWPKDITRHTAASYWLASDGSAAHVSDMLGNSEGILKRDYKALVTKVEAKKFWKLVVSITKEHR